MEEIQRNEELSIVITHSINPHQFYFKLDLGRSEHDDRQFEYFNLICDDLWDAERNNGYQPKVGDLIAVYVQPWSKWIRAHVDHVMEYFSVEKKKYILWAMDDGVPFISGDTYILRLPEEWVTTPKVSVYLGGVGPCVPVKEEFDYESMQRKLVNAENWPPLAVNLFEEALIHAQSIRFKPEYKNFKNNHYFGELEIKVSSGNRNIARDLVDYGLAAMSGDFLHDVSQISTSNKSRWLDNDDSTSTLAEMSKNFYTLAPNGKQQKIPPIMSDELQAKISDWAKHNETDLQLARDEGHLALKALDTVYDEGFRSGSDAECDTFNEHHRRLRRLNIDAEIQSNQCQEQSNTFDDECDEFLPSSPMPKVQSERRIITLIRQMKLDDKDRTGNVANAKEVETKIPGGAECETAYGRRFRDDSVMLRSKRKFN